MPTPTAFCTTFTIIIPAAGFGAGPTDPFSSSNGKAAFGHAKIHIRVQQRNGRKCITTVQGLEDDLDLKRICKAMKKNFNCNGSITEDPEMGEIVQLQGDQRQNVRDWLVEQEVVGKAEADDRIVIHGVSDSARGTRGSIRAAPFIRSSSPTLSRVRSFRRSSHVRALQWRVSCGRCSPVIAHVGFVSLT